MNFISKLFKKKTLDDIRITPSDIPAMAKIKNEDLEAWKIAFLKGIYKSLKQSSDELQKGGNVQFLITEKNGYIKDSNGFNIRVWGTYKHLVIDELKNDGWIVDEFPHTHIRNTGTVDYFCVSKP